MKLLTKEIEKKIPPMDTTNKENPKIVVKFFHPLSSWSWYVIEGEKQYKMINGKKQFDDWLFFGYVKGLEGELGYFSLSQLESVGMIERDRYFEGTLEEVRI